MAMSNDDGRQFASRAEFARLQKVSRAAVTQWAAAGRLVLAQDGRVDVAASVTRLAATLTGRGGKRARAGAFVAQPGAAEPAPTQDQTGPTLTDARRTQVIARARLDELDYDERTCRLVDKSRYDAGVADALGPILLQYDTLSTRVAPELVGQTDVRRIQDIIDNAVARLRQDTADTLRAMIVSAGVMRQ